MVMSDDDEDQKQTWEEDNDPEEPSAEIPWIIRYPLRLITNLLRLGLRLIRPYTSHLIPLFVLALTIPLITTLSLSAGWMVWHRIAVGWEKELSLQYGDGVAPHAYADLPLLAYQQPYDISLQLAVPASQPNYELGNFMTTLTLSTLSNKTIASVRKPAIVLPPFLPLIPFIWRSSRIVNLDIPLLLNTELPQQRLVAYVELGRNDQWRSLWNGQGRELSVVSASLRGVVVHTGLRGLFTRFPLLTSIAAAFTFFAISFVILASCLLPMIGQPYLDTEKVTSHPSLDQPPRKMKAKKRLDADRSVAVQYEPSADTPPKSEVKDEVKDEEMTPEPSATPLRRRKSRLSQPSDSDA